MAAATIAFDIRWLTVVLAYGFVARACTGPTLSPLGQLVTRLVRPLLRVAPRPVAGPPKRFAQAIGAAFTVAAAVLTYGADRFDAAQVVLAALIVPATLEAAAGFCVGCQIFRILMRNGIIPKSVCESCEDIWTRTPAHASNRS